MRLLLPFCFIFLLVSCSKNDRRAITPPCKIIGATYIYGPYKYNYFFTYNDKGQVSKTVYDGPDAYIKTYSYEGNMIYMSIEAGANSSTDTILLNTLGFIVTHRETTRQAVYNTSYNYNANGILISSTSQQDNYPPFTITYRVENGDFTNTSSGGITDTTSYYTDKEAVLGNLDDFYQMLYFGAFFYKNTHLKKSYQLSPYHFEYTYSFNASGNISSVVSNNGVQTDTTNFTYDCH